MVVAWVWVEGVLPWTLGMIEFFKRGVCLKTGRCLVVNGAGGGVFEEGWGDFFGNFGRVDGGAGWVVLGWW